MGKKSGPYMNEISTRLWAKIWKAIERQEKERKKKQTPTQRLVASFKSDTWWIRMFRVSKKEKKEETNKMHIYTYRVGKSQRTHVRYI